MRVKCTFLVVVLVMYGCAEIPSGIDDTIGDECKVDSDCMTGGCSGTICQSKNSEPIITTCEYLPEYACYKGINCGCVKGRCEWDKTAAFDRCVEEARKSDVVPVV